MLRPTLVILLVALTMTKRLTIVSDSGFNAIYTFTQAAREPSGVINDAHTLSDTAVWQSRRE